MPRISWILPINFIDIPAGIQAFYAPTKRFFRHQRQNPTKNTDRITLIYYFYSQNPTQPTNIMYSFIPSRPQISHAQPHNGPWARLYCLTRQDRITHKYEIQAILPPWAENSKHSKKTKPHPNLPNHIMCCFIARGSPWPKGRETKNANDHKKPPNHTTDDTKATSYYV